MKTRSYDFYTNYIVDLVSLLPLTIVFLLYRMILRLTISQNLGSINAQIWGFIQGFRFDLLVIGFILIPIVILRYIQFLLLPQAIWISWLTRAYYTVILILLGLISLYSSTFYSLFQRHFSLKILPQYNFTHWQMFIAFYGRVPLILSIFLISFSLTVIIFMLWRSTIYKTKHTFETSLLRTLYYWLAPLIITALMARGTLAPRHLEKNHCRINHNEALTQLCLNPAWAFVN